MTTIECIEQFEFPYVYVGGGIFRFKGVPIGETAPILHGQQVLDKYRELLIEEIVTKTL